ncbi:MAG TPA: hypothetical protein VK211_06340 [Kamptonema sp.]|nr:hypothetical protein [Kamptonema sp.]
MKMRRNLIATGLFLLDILSLNFALNQSAVAQQSKSGLTAAQIQQLKSLRVKIAVPTYTPPGFKVTSILIQPCPDNVTRCRFGPQYTITYQGPNNTCFAIEAVGGGIGGVDLASKLPVNSPVFGKNFIYYGSGGGNPSPTIFSDWLQGPELFYRFVGQGATDKLTNCKNINPQEAVRVTESLRYLNP